MSKPWQPGDIQKMGWMGSLQYVGQGLWRWTHEDPQEVVLVDPGRASVERLRDLYDAAYLEHNGARLPHDRKGERGNALQAALREYARPAPAIEEPFGIGAVVEDERGRLWVRVADADIDPGDPHPRTQLSPPWRRPYEAAKWWAHLKPVRVVSEGVLP